MNTYEHDKTSLGEHDHRWTPILNGEIYCSPACGGKCKEVDYQNAIDQSNLVAQQLGDGWTSHVFENLGWYWRVIKGNTQVSRSNHLYSAVMQFSLDDQNYYFEAKNSDPRQAVEAMRNQLQSTIEKLQRQFTSTDLGLIGIQQSA